MRTNKCPKCDAHNTLQSTRCHNCGADITLAGKTKIITGQIIFGIIIVAIYYMFSK